MKKLLSLVLAVIMLLSIMPMAYAERATYSPEIEEYIEDYIKAYAYVNSVYEPREQNLEVNDIILEAIGENTAIFPKYENLINIEADGRLEEITASHECFDNTNPQHTNLLRLSKAQQKYISSKLDELIEESSSTDYGSDLAAEAILTRFLVELNRLTLSTDKKVESDKSSFPFIPDVLSYINQHYCEKISLSSIADEFFISKYYLSHAFNSVVGTSVNRYITLKRLINAKQMLSSGIKPTTAAIHCGFNDYAGFYRAFTTEYGITPKEYVSKSKFTN